MHRRPGGILSTVAGGVGGPGPATGVALVPCAASSAGRSLYIPLPVQINLGSAAYADQYKKASVTLENGMTKHGSPQVIDITIIGTPTPAAIAFVKYTLSATGLAQYKTGGFSLPTPTIVGSASSVPSEISSEVGSS